MSFNPEVHHRRSIRLRDYDYSSAGAYFVTVCTRNRECLLGEVVEGEMVPNDAGRWVQTAWDALPDRFAGLELGDFVVMPNHIHGIIVLVGAGLALPQRGAASRGAASSAPTLGEVVRAFKSISALKVNRALSRSGSFWQRNYYEHVIRDMGEWERIQAYIIANPANWADDPEYPDHDVGGP